MTRSGTKSVDQNTAIAEKEGRSPMESVPIHNIKQKKKHNSQLSSERATHNLRSGHSV